MKIAYISNYKNDSGYSQAARDMILALDSVGIEVVPRSVKMLNNEADVPQRILDLEDNDLDNVDVIIQHNLPSEFSYKSGALNVGLFSYETNTVKYTGWVPYLKLMDKVIASTRHMARDLEELGIPNSQCGFPVDTDKFENKYTLDLPERKTRFYAIGEMTKRKNWSAMILSYLSAFTSRDDVVLVIKTNDVQKMQKLCENIRQNISKPSIMQPEIYCIPNRLTDLQMIGLHNWGNVYLSASYGEAWNLPCIDALGFGNRVIVPGNTAFIDYVYMAFGEMIDCASEPCVNEGGSNLYTTDELWESIDKGQLVEAMKKIHNQEDSSHNINDRKTYIKNNFSYEHIGNEMKDILNAEQTRLDSEKYQQQQA